jgi:hypothetical protein
MQMTIPQSAPEIHPKCAKEKVRSLVTERGSGKNPHFRLRSFLFLLLLLLQFHFHSTDFVTRAAIDVWGSGFIYNVCIKKRVFVTNWILLECIYLESIYLENKLDLSRKTF